MQAGSTHRQESEKAVQLPITVVEQLLPPNRIPNRHWLATAARTTTIVVATATATMAILAGCTTADSPTGAGTSAAPPGIDTSMMPTTGNDVAPSPPPATPTTTSMTNTGTIQATNTDSAEPREGLHAVDPAVLSADGNGITWVSPSGNIWCRISEGEYGSGCQARDAPVPNGATCVNPTFTVEQLSKGFYLHPDSVQPACFNQGVFTTEHPTALEYGQSVTTGGYTCISRRSGMACTTAGGDHGFELSTETASWF